MRVGITTGSNVNPVAAALIHLLDAQSDRPVCVLFAEQPRLGTLRRYVRRLGLLPAARMIWGQYRGARSAGQATSADYLRAHLQARGLVEPLVPLADLCKRMDMAAIKVGNVNAAESVDAVRNMELDVLVNAGGGIFRAALIAAPRVGILNAHMGFLPTFRGMNVLEWGVFHGQTPSVSVHFIDGGIDTGDVLTFGEVPFEQGDSIATLRAKATVKGVELLAATIAALKAGGAHPKQQRLEDGKQYFVMHPRLLAITEARLARRGEERNEA